MALPNTYTFRLGEGQISGFLSAAFGLLGCLAVLCYRLPWLLSFPALRAAEDPRILRPALGVALVLALLLGLVNFCIGRWRTLGYLGMGGACLALILGGATAQADGSNRFSALPIGLDWFILDLIASAIIFIPAGRGEASCSRRVQPCPSCARNGGSICSTSPWCT